MVEKTKKGLMTMIRLKPNTQLIFNLNIYSTNIKIPRLKFRIGSIVQFKYFEIRNGINYICLCDSEDELHTLEYTLFKEWLDVGAIDVIADNKSVPINNECIKKSEQVLIDNGIEKDEASTVLQAIGYTLLNTELYPER